jgi:outer membrane protein assembly factor BamB
MKITTLCTLAIALWFGRIGLCADDLNEQLWDAARRGDVKTIESLAARGADIEAKTHYGATALWLAASKGQLEAVKALLARRADPNVLDRVWGQTPAAMAAEAEKPLVRTEMMKALLAHGADQNAALMESAASGNADVVAIVLAAGKPAPEALAAALFLNAAPETEVTKTLKAAGAKPLLPALKALSAYQGTFETHNGMKLTVAVRDGILWAKSAYGDAYVLEPEGWVPQAGQARLQAVGLPYVHFVFDRDATGTVFRATRQRGTIELPFERSTLPKNEQKSAATPLEDDAASVTTPEPWPSFRGQGASGVADGQHPPATWDIDKGTNIRWKVSIPGLAHSSPIVWGDRVFVTTAVSSNAKTDFKPGLYGAGTSSSDTSKHAWRVYCLSAGDGRIIWDRTAQEGVPKFKRHIKSSQNNQTPATDGSHVVAYFGSEGLYCYDSEGKLLWHQDVGAIDAGAFNDPDAEWGAASSPIIYRDLVVVQCDRHKDSFIAAYDIATGRPVWSTPRDEQPSWSTPTVIQGPGGDELVTNAPRFARSYDPRTGRELWRLGPHSEIAVPTPFLAQGLIFIADGYHPIQPIYAVLPGGSGDISPKGGDSGHYVAWSRKRGGPYMPTPIVYGQFLYTCSNSGVLACYEARTGREVYKARLGGSNGYSASPVAADGRLYFAGEDGDVRVVKAGPQYQLLADNKMKEPCMATPAISNGMIFIRTQHWLYGIGRQQK